MDALLINVRCSVNYLLKPVFNLMINQMAIILISARRSSLPRRFGSIGLQIEIMRSQTPIDDGFELPITEEQFLNFDRFIDLRRTMQRERERES